MESQDKAEEQGVLHLMQAARLRILAVIAIGIPLLVPFCSRCIGFLAFGSQWGIPIGAPPLDVALMDLDGDGRRETVAVLTATPTSRARSVPTPRFPSDAGSVSVFRVDTNGAVWRVSETILYREVLFFLAGGGGCLLCVQKEGLTAREPVQLQPWGIRAGESNRLIILSNRFGGLYDLSGTTLSAVSLINFGTFSSTRNLQDLILVEGDPSIAVADMNTDGATDLIIATLDDRLVRVLAGDGRGNVEQKSPMLRQEVGGRGDEPRFIGAANLTNYPGYPALAIVVTKGGILSNEIQVVAARGDGRFVAGRPIPATNQPRSAVWGDFDSDGVPDLVVAGVNNLVFLKGTGMSPEGVPQFSGKSAVGDVSIPVDLNLPVKMAAWDYDLDRRLDLAVANYSAGTVDVWRGNGDGTFTRTHRLRFGDEARPVAIVVGDLDGNQLPDIVVVCQGSNEVAVALNLGALGIMTRDVARQVPGRLFTVAQVDGDPGDDLVTLYTTETVLTDQTVARSESLGGVPVPYVETVVIAHAQPISDRLPALASFPTPEPLRYELIPSAALERAIAEGKFTEAKARALNLLVGKVDPPTPTTAVTTGPLITVVAGGSAISDWERDAGIATPMVTGSASGYTPTALAAGDLDGDGIAEVVFVDQARRAVVAYKLFLVGPNRTPWEWGAPATGRFLQSYVLRSSPSTHPAPVGFVIGDFVPATPGGDIALLNARSNTVEILEVFYDPTRPRDSLLQGRVVGWGITGPAPAAAAAIDLNGDDRLDLVVLSSEQNAVSLLIRNREPEGDPVRLLFETTSFTDPRLAMPIAAISADLDGDGRPELAIAGFQSKNITLYSPRGGTLESRAEVKLKSNPYSIAVGDVNSDGLQDIVAVSAAGLEIALGTGKMTFADPTVTPTAALGGLPFWVAIGDFNADRKADIAVAMFEPGVLGKRLEGVKVFLGPYR